MNLRLFGPLLRIIGSEYPADAFIPDALSFRFQPTGSNYRCLRRQANYLPDNLTREAREKLGTLTLYNYVGRQIPTVDIFIYMTKLDYPSLKLFTVKHPTRRTCCLLNYDSPLYFFYMLDCGKHLLRLVLIASSS